MKTRLKKIIVLIMIIMMTVILVPAGIFAKENENLIVKNLSIFNQEKSVSILGDETIEFKDVNLKNAILDSGYDENYQGIDKNKDHLISKKEIATLVTLFVVWRDITSLEGLENAVNLKSLYLNNNPRLTNVSLLKNLTNIAN